jgi:hypothetical protein
MIGMGAKSITIVRAEAADFFCDCWAVKFPSDERVGDVAGSVHYHAQGLGLKSFQDLDEPTFRKNVAGMIRRSKIHIFRSEAPKCYYILFPTYEGNHNNLPRDVVELAGLFLRKAEFESPYSDWLGGRGLIPGIETFFSCPQQLHQLCGPTILRGL